MSLNNISKDNENFLKDFLKDFYRQVIKIEDYDKFENNLTEWVQQFFEYNKKDSNAILELMKNHKENKNWFSSLIGFFYENGLVVIGDNNNDTTIITTTNSLTFYLSSINQYYEKEENKKLTDLKNNTKKIVQFDENNRETNENSHKNENKEENTKEQIEEDERRGGAPAELDGATDQGDPERHNELPLAQREPLAEPQHERGRPVGDRDDR